MTEQQNPTVTRGFLRRRWVRVTGASVLVLLLVWLVGCWLVVVHPKTNRTQHADAVLVLGSPNTNGRLEVGRALIAQGLASTLVISVPAWLEPHIHVCSDGIAGVQVICFQPHPATTEGEAREFGDLAAKRGWTKVIVVTSTYHVSRARMIVERCFPGTVYLAKADRSIGVTEWAYQFLYQTGAYVKAFAEPSC